MHEVLWNSPPIPREVLDREDFPHNVRARAHELVETDEPSSSDIWHIFGRYDISTPEERDAIDAAFVWFTGYTLATIAAQIVAKDPDSYEDVINEWRKRAARCEGSS